MAHSRSNHLLQMALIFLELELEIICPISKNDHGTWYVIILNIDYVQSNNFTIVELIVLLLAIVNSLNNLVETILFAKYQGIFN